MILDVYGWLSSKLAAKHVNSRALFWMGIGDYVGMIFVALTTFLVWGSCLEILARSSYARLCI